jgi:hypothetical protein
LGIVAEFMPSKEDAATVQKAMILRGQLTFLEDQEDNSDGYTGPDAKGNMVTWPQSEVRRMLRGVRREFEDIGADAKAIEREANRKLNEVLAIGKAAIKAGWKPGQATTTVASPGARTTTNTAIPSGVRTGGAPAGASGGAGKSSSVTRSPSRASTSVVPTNREDLAESLGAKLMSPMAGSTRGR